ncbi:hypothetical protein SUGI_0573360 [Cryptomeria japonica]|nr:hypothetical protein SUGI_0573360 [Cryptomeria japonica]
MKSDPRANKMLYTYDILFHGFAAWLSKAEAETMDAMYGCLDVIPSSLNTIATVVLGNQEMYKGTPTYSQLDDATLHRPLPLRITNLNTLLAINMTFTIGEKIKAYITSTGSVKGLIVVGKETMAPIVVASSSRGPSKGYPQSLKPDMIAPSVNILAVYAGEFPYKFLSWTSMACPHVSSIAALVKAMHPTWSPTCIKSAHMMSSYLTGNVEQPIKDSYDMELANPLALGAGHVDPNSVRMKK